LTVETLTKLFIASTQFVFGLASFEKKWV